MPQTPVKSDAERNTMAMPSQDPWYTAPSCKLKSHSPGTVLSVCKVLDGLSVYNNAAEAYHLMYRTTDSHYKPTWAVTSLLVPKSPCTLNSGHMALVSYQIAYNSPSIDWSPSYRIFEAPLENKYGIPTDHDKINLMLGRGWYVAVPDFEGPRAVFTATVSCGHAVLDGLRSAISYLRYNNVETDKEIANFKYAIDLTGSVLGSLVSDVNSLFRLSNGTAYAGNVALAILGLVNEYPELDTYLQSRLKTEGPQNAASFLTGRKLDSLGAFKAFQGQDIYSYFIGGEADFKQSPLFSKIRHVEWMLGYHGVPQIPLYIHKAIQDEMAPIDETDHLVSHYRRFGCQILYERNTAGRHVAEIVNGQERALEWLAAAFVGFRNPSSDTFETRDVTVDFFEPPKFS
ncbi:LIP-domain-containing protein [Xylariaceae sp. FL0255]|nr:LIP-domain-containing protein [Xylariaceae sp. FL0255]